MSTELINSKRLAKMDDEIERLRKHREILLLALKKAELALLNCIPIVRYPGDGPLVDLRKALAEVEGK